MNNASVILFILSLSVLFSVEQFGVSQSLKFKMYSTSVSLKSGVDVSMRVCVCVWLEIELDPVQLKSESTIHSLCVNFYLMWSKQCWVCLHAEVYYLLSMKFMSWCVWTTATEHSKIGAGNIKMHINSSSWMDLDRIRAFIPNTCMHVESLVFWIIVLPDWFFWFWLLTVCTVPSMM